MDPLRQGARRAFKPPALICGMCKKLIDNSFTTAYDKNVSNDTLGGLFMTPLPKEPELAALLRDCFLFQGMPADVAAETLNRPGCTYAAFGAGEALYTPSRFRRAVALLAHGEAAAYKPHASERTVLNTFGPGAVFGVAAVFAPQGRYVAQIEAKKPCRVLFLSQPLLEELFELDIRAAKNYIAYLSGRIRYLNGRIDGFTADSAVEKLALFLWDLYARQGETMVLPCDMTKLSATLDLGRASLYRAFGRLKADGILDRSGKDVFLLDPQGLQALLPPGLPINNRG